MKTPLLVVSVLMVFAAIMLVTSVGDAAMWIAAITIGIAIVAIIETRTHRGAHR
ncbi:MAG TPA: hypothetical protein VGK49_07290 [Ilumatobacteraceae bacterium]